MLSIEECRAILEANGTRIYTDDEIGHLRFILYQIARLSFRLAGGGEVDLPDEVTQYDPRLRPKA